LLGENQTYHINNKEEMILEEDIKERLDRLNSKCEKTFDSFEKQAKSSESRAESSGKLDIIFRAITAILSVAARALVTYSVAPNVRSAFKLFAILLTGVAGLPVTPQAIFAFK
jgi:hypothetical protein